MVWASRTRDRVVLAVVLVVVAVLMGLEVRDHPSLSHFDELQHMDYTLKSPFHVVRHGELIGQEAMDEAACRGVDYPLRLGIQSLNNWLRLVQERAVVHLSPEIVTRAGFPACRSLLTTPDQFTHQGINTASIHPPTYYTTTALVGRAIEAAPGVGSPVTAARLVSILWLWAAIAVLWYVLGSLEVPSGAKAILTGLLAVSPLVLHEHSIIHPDTTALFGGALVLAAVLRWEAGRTSGWLVALVALVAVWLKFTNAAAVGAALMYLAIRAYQRREHLSRPQVRRTLVLGVAVVALIMASAMTWASIQSHRGFIPPEHIPTNAVNPVDAFQWNYLGDELFSALTPLQDLYVPDSLPRAWLEPLGDLINLLALIGLGAVAYVTPRGSPHRALAVAAVLAMVMTGIVTMVGTYWSLSTYFHTHSRYGLSVLPLAVAAVAPTLSRRSARWLAASVLLATAGATLVGVVT